MNTCIYFPMHVCDIVFRLWLYQFLFLQAVYESSCASTSLFSLVVTLLCCFHYNAFISLMLSFAFSWMWLGSSIFFIGFVVHLDFLFCELPAPIFHWVVFFLLWLFYIFWTVMHICEHLSTWVWCVFNLFLWNLPLKRFSMC